MGAPIYDIAMLRTDWCALHSHLFPGDKKESVAILLCGLGKSEGYTRLMVREIIPISQSDCYERTPSKVSWWTENYLTDELVEKMDNQGLSLVKVHSHPAGHNKFSITDNDNDRLFFSSVHGWFDDGRPHGALVMLPDGNMFGRIVESNGKFNYFSKISVVGSKLQIWPRKKVLSKKNEQFGLRVMQIFGKGTFQALRGLKVGVVGCSGTGSIVAELLARNCVGSMVLVDADRVEEKNLNRILNSTARDARVSALKVDVIGRAIQKMGMKTKIQKIAADTYDHQVRESLKSCDVLFGCVDSYNGRYHLECISTAYLIPYFDVGVHLDADESGGISEMIAAAHYVCPGGLSLMERGIYNSKQLLSEGTKRNDPKRYEKEQAEGYLLKVGEDHPAVISINMQAACMGVNDFLARLHNYRHDDNADFAIQQFSFTNGAYYNSAEQNQPKYFIEYLGEGDRCELLKGIQ